MIKQRYFISDDMRFYDGEIPLRFDDVLQRLNEYEYNVKKLQSNINKLQAKEELCKSYEKKYIETNKKNRMYRSEILELRNILTDYETNEIESDANYWKGIGKAYEKQLADCHERISILERDNVILKLRVGELEDDML